MSVIIEISVPAEDFALGRVFGALRDLVVEVERLASHGREQVLPFLWVRGGETAAFEAAAADDPTVADLAAIEETEDAGLYVVHWAEDVAAFVDQVVDLNGVVMEAAAWEGEWRLTFRFPDEAEVDEFRSFLEERSLPYEVRRVYDEDAATHREYDLTPGQREILLVGLEMGFFEVPRDATLPELADRLGVSSNSASQRLRRATRNLVRNALATSPPGNA